VPAQFPIPSGELPTPWGECKFKIKKTDAEQATIRTGEEQAMAAADCRAGGSAWPWGKQNGRARLLEPRAAFPPAPRRERYLSWNVAWFCGILGMPFIGRGGACGGSGLF
jgi:hypothetical protein